MSYYCPECFRIWYYNPPTYNECPKCETKVLVRLPEPIKIKFDPGPQPGREDVNLTELSEDKADAIRAIVAGRSVIYRCEIRDASIYTTAGYVLAGNRFKDVRVNDAPQIVSGNDMENTQVGQSMGSRVTRNVMK